MDVNSFARASVLYFDENSKGNTVLDIVLILVFGE